MATASSRQIKSTRTYTVEEIDATLSGIAKVLPYTRSNLQRRKMFDRCDEWLDKRLDTECLPQKDSK